MQEGLFVIVATALCLNVKCQLHDTTRKSKRIAMKTKQMLETIVETRYRKDQNSATMAKREN